MNPPLLSVEDLSVEFRTREGVVQALDRVGFTVAKGETVGIVGESGSGKSVTALAVMGILHPAARVAGGRAVFGGLDLLAASERQRREYRGRELSMIFQSPRTALNPIRTVGRQIADVLLRHANLPRTKVKARAVELLARAADETDWRQIVALYEELMRITASPVVALNHAAAVAISEGPERGLSLVEAAGADGALQNYYLFHASRADLLRRLNRSEEAAAAYEQALSLSTNEVEQNYIRKRLLELRR